MLRFFRKVVCFSAVCGLGFSAPVVYVTNSGSSSNSVSVIPTRNNIPVVPNVGVGETPWGIALTPDGAYAYVVNSGPGGSVLCTVSVIQTSDNIVIATIPVGDNPSAIAITPDGAYAYVTNYNSHTVSVIQTSDNTVIKSIDVAVNPYGIAITPDGAYAYVTHATSSGIVSVIRTSDNTVTKSIDVVAVNPRGIAITPDGAYAYVTTDGTTTTDIKVIRTSDNTVLPDIIEVGNDPYGIAITPDGAYAYVPDSGGTVSVIRISTNEVLSSRILVGTDLSAIAITPDGAYAYVTNRPEGTVSVIRISDNTVLPDTIDVGGVGSYPNGIAFTPMFGTFTYSMEYDQALSGKYYYAQINWGIKGVSYKLFRNGKFIKEFGPDEKSYNDYDVNPSITYIYTLEVTQNNNAEGSTYGPTYVEKFTARRIF